MSLREQLNDKALLDKALHHIYSSKAKFKRASSKGYDDISIQEFLDKKCIYLLELFKELYSNKFSFSPLKGIPIKKEEKGKFRLITVANVKDRLVHKAILAIIHPILFTIIDTKVSYCGVKNNVWGRKDKKGLNTRRAFKQIIKHIRNRKFYVFKADIKGFYDNVPKEKLVSKLADHIKDSEMMSLIREVIHFKLHNPEEFTGTKASLLPKENIGISQGSSLSQMFANIYLCEFDLKMKEKFGDSFIRYVDDFIMLFENKEQAKEAKEYAKILLAEEGLELSTGSNKTRTISLKNDYVNFLGIRIDKNALSYKRNKADTKIYIKSVLDEKNLDLYRRYKDIKEIVAAMNYKIQGIGDYLSFYHTEETYNEINKLIKNKRRFKKFKSLKLLDKKRLKPIIPKKEWEILLKR